MIFDNEESLRNDSALPIIRQSGSGASRSIMWAIFYNITLAPMISGLVFKCNLLDQVLTRAHTAAAVFLVCSIIMEVLK